MALVTTPATVLKTYEYSETSKILRLLTRDHGLCSAIAKGARRPKSRFGGLLEPFTDGLATFYTREGRELHTLSAFELRRERQALGRELVRFAGAGLLTELVLRFAPSAPDRELFRQLGRGLDRLLEVGGDAQAMILEEAWRLIAQLGFAPSVDRCSVCGTVAPAEETAHFDLTGGSIVCANCRRAGGPRNLLELKPQARAELAALISGRWENGRALAASRFQRQLLRDFIAYHLADQRPLNSFRFLDERLR